MELSYCLGKMLCMFPIWNTAAILQRWFTVFIHSFQFLYFFLKFTKKSFFFCSPSPLIFGCISWSNWVSSSSNCSYFDAINPTSPKCSYITLLGDRESFYPLCLALNSNNISLNFIHEQYFVFIANWTYISTHIKCSIDSLTCLVHWWPFFIGFLVILFF